MRVERWYKGIFVLLGAFLASILSNQDLRVHAYPILFGLISVSCISFANYIINECFDKNSDKFHPIHKNRVLVKRKLNPLIVCYMYFTLLGLGLMFAMLISIPIFITSVLLMILGIAYNIKPLRVKDMFFLDILADSFSGPLRFLLGWFIIVGFSMPPAVFLLCLWTGGAYCMARKRYSEYQLFGGSKDIVLYRKSFSLYSAKILKCFSSFYALCFVLMFYMSIDRVITHLIK